MKTFLHFFACRHGRIRIRANKLRIRMAQKPTAPYPEPEHWRNLIIFLMRDVLPIPCGEECGEDALRWVPQWDWSSWNSSRGFAAAAAAQPVASQFLLMFHILLKKQKPAARMSRNNGNNVFLWGSLVLEPVLRSGFFLWIQTRLRVFEGQKLWHILLLPCCNGLRISYGDFPDMSRYRM